MSIYDDARNVATELLAEFAQGTVLYVTLTHVPGATPDAPGTPVPSETAVNATVQPVSTRYVDGSHIVMTDKQVTIANDGSITPDMDGSLKIDGLTHKIIEIMPRPAAGDPVTWTIIVRR